MLPSSLEVNFADSGDHIECREAIRGGSRTFFMASMLLPASTRRAAFGLYAFCRLSDDAVDIGGGSLHAVERLRDRLARACEGRPFPHAADRAMAEVLSRHAIPRAIPEALLEGLAWDARGRRYETLDDLMEYAARVAGTVGVMMALIMGVREPDALARACDLGVAMQLTNIARDVGEDARAGRLYLPVAWLREAGIDPDAFLRDPRLTPALQGAIARLLAEADRLYISSRTGIAALPFLCRPAILTAAMLYAEIGRRLEGLAFDSISRRASVPGSGKLRILAQAVLVAPWLENAPRGAPLDAVAFLIASVVGTPAPVAAASARAARPIPRFVRVLAILERLERSEQFGE